jgi:hypothetical protein
MHLKLDLLLLVQQIEYRVDVFAQAALQIIKARRHFRQLTLYDAAKKKKNMCYGWKLRVNRFFYSLSLAFGQYDVGACWKTSSSGLLLFTLGSFGFSLTPHEQVCWLTALSVIASLGCCSSEALRR